MRANDRGELRWPWQLAIGAALVLLCMYLWNEAGALVTSEGNRFVFWPIIEERTSWVPWIPISILVAWRWGWAFLHWTRAAIYRFFVFPSLRRQAEAAVTQRGPVPELAVLAVTYKEDPGITAIVFGSVFDEIARVEGLVRPALVVVCTGCDEDDAAVRAAHEAAAARVAPERRAELVLMRGTDGKRGALATGLEHIIAWRQHPEDGAFVMMDGDTHMEPGAISRALCFLRLDPPITAMTTDEDVVVRGRGWLSEWLHLRHGLRDLYTSSVALSKRLLCLTGRYSIFRADALEPGFIEIVRHDQVQNWLWGRYTLLSGDDKSTWYHLLARGARMLYLPDCRVVTHEIVTGSAMLRAYHNIRRWGGNSVRNSERAIQLGPHRVGLFPWWCLIDQRLSMWTVLVGPTALLMMALSNRWDLACAYLLWVIVSRTFRVAPAWIHAGRISVVYAPLSAFFDWASALVKIWIVYFPAKQFWFNRGGRTLDSTRRAHGVHERRAAAGMLLGAALLSFGGFVAWLTGTMQVDRDLAIMLEEIQHAPAGRAIVGLLVTLLVSAAILVAGRLRQGAQDV